MADYPGPDDIQSKLTAPASKNLSGLYPSPASIKSFLSAPRGSGRNQLPSPASILVGPNK